MNKLILILLVMIPLLGYPQQVKRSDYKTYKIVLSEDGPFTLFLGTTIIATNYFIHYTYDGNGVSKEVKTGGLVFATTIGVGLYVISFDRKKIQRSKTKF